jgi:hypothetical protein
VSEEIQLTPELQKVLDSLFVRTKQVPDLIYDPDCKVVIEMVNQVRDKLEREGKP